MVVYLLLYPDFLLQIPHRLLYFYMYQRWHLPVPEIKLLKPDQLAENSNVCKNEDKTWGRKTHRDIMVSTKFETDDARWGTAAICGRWCHWRFFKFILRNLDCSLALSCRVLIFPRFVLLNTAASLDTVTIPASSPSSYSGLFVTSAMRLWPDRLLTGSCPDQDSPLLNLSMIARTKWWCSSSKSSSTALWPTASKSLYPYSFSAAQFLQHRDFFLLYETWCSNACTLYSKTMLEFTDSVFRTTSE